MSFNWLRKITRFKRHFVEFNHRLVLSSKTFIFSSLLHSFFRKHFLNFKIKNFKTILNDLESLSKIHLKLFNNSMWRMPVAFLLMVIAIFLYTYNLDINGYANNYYSAAVQAATVSWKAFFFGSLDAGNFITIDKPPVPIWFMALFCRVFGFSTWSILLPNAIAGVLTVLLVYLTAERYFGLKRAIIAALAVILTPIATLMFRFNNPDSFLTLWMVASGYYFLLATEGKKSWKYLFLTAFFTGLAFNTKMLQGLMLLPIFFLIYLFSSPHKLIRRLWELFYFSVLTIIFSLWWSVAVMMTPVNNRPYIGSSSNNSVWNLIVRFNGLDRIFANESEQFVIDQILNNKRERKIIFQMPSASSEDDDFSETESKWAGKTGLLRMFNNRFGYNIAWFIPLAIFGGISFIVININKYKKFSIKHQQLVFVIFYLSWLVIHAVIFSFINGAIHAYYSVVMAPAIAVLVGVTIPMLKLWLDSNNWKAFFVPVVMWASAAVAFNLLAGNGNQSFLGYIILIVATINCLILWFVILLSSKKNNILRSLLFIISCLLCLIGPLLYNIFTIESIHQGSLPTAGKFGFDVFGTNDIKDRVNYKLVDYLLKNKGSATWLAATGYADKSSFLQIASNQPVMAVGGFTGGDKILSIDQLVSYVTDGKLKFYLISEGESSDNSLRNDNYGINKWVKENGILVADFQGKDRLYRLSSK